MTERSFLSRSEELLLFLSQTILGNATESDKKEGRSLFIIRLNVKGGVDDAI